jgi:hypothetical protein
LVQQDVFSAVGGVVEFVIDAMVHVVDYVDVGVFVER